MNFGPEILPGNATLYCGDCLDVLLTLAENSIDACVCDPPYHLTSIVKRFGKADIDGSGTNEARARAGADAAARLSRGFMGKQWDGGDIAFRPETWREVYRVLKPGAHLLACGGTRTYHRMACAIEDAGFEVRDCVQWLYGSGFPKSHDVAVAIDKQSGVPARGKAFNMKGRGPRAEELDANGREFLPPYEPATDAALQWEGWGTALKPACEPIVLARKPLSEKTVAANVMRWGCGALNIDGCRIEGQFKSGWSDSGSKASENIAMSGANYERPPKPDSINGRWPANVIHDGSDEVVGIFPDARSSGNYNAKDSGNIGDRVTNFGGGYGTPATMFTDSGSAARFFYTAKADSDDRLGSRHPTVKPLDLMQYLVRLITPPGGTVLDPFSGTGTTGEAAWREGMRAVLIEREAEYQADIRRRMKLALAGPDERARETLKASGKANDDPGPLFAGMQNDV